MNLDQAQKEWELLLRVCDSWEVAARFLDGLVIDQ